MVEIEIEKMSYFHKHKDLDSPVVTLWRFNSKGVRYYFSCIKDNITFYPSVTSILNAVIPKDDFLIKWIADKGYNNAMIERDTKASYGTLMHALFANFLTTKTIALTAEYIQSVAGTLNLKYYENHWVYELQKDLISFAQLCYDYKIKPLAVEIILANDIYKMAGAIDLVCELEFKGETKTAIIDFKSGKSGFNPDSNIYQLMMYKKMWDCNYPQKTIDMLFNWNPKDFRTSKPTYTFANQTDKGDMFVLENYINIFHSKHKTNPCDIFRTHGIVKLGDEPNNNIEFINVENYIKSKFFNK